ncbi:CopG family transcriptional regulator [Novosphingobium sp. BL-8H]|uniref:CopG family transcriptional regulator n=1 Tax=Novosphingobium sp. BL-8H TaxID=3127640 RepID=UPI003757E6D1
MSRKIRHQVFLTQPVSDRLANLAAGKGVSKSDLLATAFVAWLDRAAYSELDEMFGRRLDAMTHKLDRLVRESSIELETLALFIRYVLTVSPPLAEDDQSGRAAGSLRFEAFLSQVARQVALGKRTLGGETGR